MLSKKRWLAVMKVKEQKTSAKASGTLKYLLIALAGSVAVAAIAFVMISQVRKNAIELQYGDYSITKVRYDELIAEAHELSLGTDEAREALIESLKAQAAAKEVGIEEDEYMPAAAVLALETAGRKIEDTKEESYYQRVQYGAAIETRIDYLEKGGYLLANFEIPFTRKIYIAEMAPFGEHSEEEGTAIPTHEEILTEVAYAKEQADRYHAQIESGEATVEQIIEEIHTNERLGYGGAANASGVVTIPLRGTLERGDGMVVDYGGVHEMLAQQEVGYLEPVTEMTGSRFYIEYPEELNREEELVLTGYRFSYYLEKNEAHPELKQAYAAAKEGM